VPAKNCSFNCVYCQAGRTLRLTVERRRFFPLEMILGDVEARLREAEEKGVKVDYISIVPEGEPTLDAALGELIRALKGYGRPVAVFTNGSLLWRSDVRGDLSEADLVNLKVDAAREETWRRVDRPHPSLGFRRHVEGLRVFAESYSGVLYTETMLVGGVEYGEEIGEIAGLVAALRPAKAFIAAPVRPPAEPVPPPREADVLALYGMLEERLGGRVELLIGLPPVDLEALEDPERDLLAAAGVHPLRLREAERLLREAGADPGIIARLVEKGLLRVEEYGGERFLVRRLV